MKDIAEYRKKTIEELEKELSKFREELQETVSDILLKKEKNTKKASFLKKDIARIKTLIREKLKEEQK